jgi:hypothetical protein
MGIVVVAHAAASACQSAVRLRPQPMPRDGAGDHPKRDEAT